MKKLILIAFLFTSFCGFAQKDTLTTEAIWPLGIAEHNGILYIAEADANEITTLDLGSTSQVTESFITNMERPNFLQVSGDYLYYSEFNGDRISKVDLTQASPTPEIVISGISVSDILIDGTDLYYTNSFSVNKLDLTATDPVSIVVAEGLNGPMHVIKYEDYLYFTQFGGGEISKISLTAVDPMPETFLSGLSGPLGGLAIHEDELYFFQFNNSDISKVEIASATQTITTVDTDIAGGDLLFIDDDLYATDFQKGLVIRYNDIIILDAEEILTQDLNIHPNPTTDYINFSQDQNYMIENISIIDVSGALVGQENYTIGNSRVDLSNLPSGIYFVTFRGDSWIQTEKIIRL